MTRHLWQNRLLVNNGSASVDRSVASGADDPGTSFTAAAADYDNHGWLDPAVGRSRDRYELLRNATPPEVNAGSLVIELLGTPAIGNGAIGTVVEVKMSDGRTQRRAVTVCGRLCAGSDKRLHFGTGNAEIESLQFA